MMADDGSIEMLRSIVGEGVGDDMLRALLLRAGGDVSSAANTFFDGGLPTLGNNSDEFGRAPAAAVGDEVLGTLFKTLEDQGRKLAGKRTHVFFPAGLRSTRVPGDCAPGWLALAACARTLPTTIVAPRRL